MTITIIGTDASGKVVAQERTTDSRKAEQIASYLRSSGLAGGLAVEVIDPAAIETDPAKASELQGVQSRVTPSASILWHPGASLSR